MIDGEIVKEVEEFPGYYVSTSGRVWSSPRRGRGGHNGKWLKPKKLRRKDGSYYLFVSLYKNGMKKGKLVHRLVAESFIPNFQSKPEVNHLDGDKTNNDWTNLQWVTKAENEKHAWDSGLKENNRKAVSKAKSKQVKCLETGEVFSSAEEASKYIGLNNQAVSCAIHNGCRAGGYTWRYV
jgi:hypothetical protein